MNVSLHNSTNNAAYEIRSSNDWIADAKRREMPRQLIGELWRERELAVLYGDPGSAKSVFAMQAAETLARGGSFAPFSSRVDARPVVYIDTMSNDKQFESRYAAD
ncbi:MAG: AAA family ATPase, partial [Blastocatellia bacterium]|nr:AAA family ATPase [Blastocatellia bacterium]